jgi:hypothetical protein
MPITIDNSRERFEKKHNYVGHPFDAETGKYWAADIQSDWEMYRSGAEDHRWADNGVKCEWCRDNNSMHCRQSCSYQDNQCVVELPAKYATPTGIVMLSGDVIAAIEASGARIK